MIDLKSLLKLANQPHTVPLMRAVVFDGRNAIALGNSRDPQPWWAGVPYPQDDIVRSGKGPRAVPVDAITKHFLRSRHLKVAPDHLHNGTGMRTEWDKTTDWNDALTLLPQPPEGEPAMFDLELDALDRVLIAAAEGDIRHSLNAVLLDLTHGRIAASDGARLHLYDKRVPKLTAKKGQPPELHVLLPKAAAKWLLFSDDKTAKVTIWKLGTDKPLVLMQTSDGLVFTSAVVGKFPDYMRIVRQRAHYLRWARLHPVQLAESVKSMAKLNAIDKPKMPGVAVQWAEGRVYAGSGPNFVAFDCQLTATPGAWHAPASQMFAHFNPRFLEDVADCVTEAAEWCLQGPAVSENALAVFDGDFSALVMPQREKQPPTDQQPAKGPKKPAKAPKPSPAPAKPAKPAPVPAKAPSPAPTATPAPKPAPVPAKAPAKPAKGPKPAPAATPAPEPGPKASQGPRRPSRKGTPRR